MRSELENVLDVSPHVELLQHLVALVEDKVTDRVEVEDLLLGQLRRHRLKGKVHVRGIARGPEWRVATIPPLPLDQGKSLRGGLCEESEEMMPNLLNTAGGSDDDAGHLLLELILLLLDGDASEEVANLDTPEPAAEALKLVTDLKGAEVVREMGGIDPTGERSRTWKASSRVWHKTMADTSPGLGSSC